MTERGWRILLVVLAVGVWATMLGAQIRTVTFAIGRFGGTDQEIQECYFSIGSGAMLVLNPRGEFCQVAREMVGRTGTLFFTPDAP